MDSPEQWLLSAEERGNPHTTLPAWTEGNLAEPLLHGSTYFDRLVEEVRSLNAGDHLFFTDWRGDPDERLREDGPTVVELFTEAVKKGVCVRGLVWRSHMSRMSLNKEANRALDQEIEHGGGKVILDQRIRRLGSHHQKLVVLRHDEAPEKDVAFVGGIDLCYSRRDDAEHRGDPQGLPMASAYGPNPPWHDVQLMIRGPAVSVLDTVFRERWDDPNSPDEDHPIAWIHDKLHHTRLHADPLPPQLPPPPECGPHFVQNLRTYPAIRPPYDFAGRRAVGGPRLHEGDQAGPAADLPRGPVHVVGGGRPVVRRGARRPPGPAPRRRGPPGPRPGRRLRRAAPVRGALAGPRDVPEGRRRAGARLRRREPRR